MKEFEKKRVTKKRLYSKFTAIILLIILAFLVKGTIGIYQKSMESKRKLDLAATRLSQLEEKYGRIEGMVEEAKSKVGQEEQLRSKFLLAKEGEHAVFIIDQDEEPEPEEETSVLSDFWHKTASWFKF